LASYSQDGPAALARSVRHDAGRRRSPPELVALIEGPDLRKPRSSAAAIHRRISAVAESQGWPIPSYGTVHAILAGLDPAMATLALDGPVAFRDHLELVHRHRAGASDALWQADHTLLDILVLDEAGQPARPWLTTVIDDHSRAVAGYSTLVIGAT
jgi:putative transposase